MTTFNIYKNSNGDLRAVKIGFSWLGFFFPQIWLFFKQMWIAGVVILSLSIVIGIVDNLVLDFIGLALCFIIGFIGNEEIGKNLIKQGYAAVGIERAGNNESAIAVYTNNNSSSKRPI